MPTRDPLMHNSKQEVVSLISYHLLWAGLQQDAAISPSKLQLSWTQNRHRESKTWNKKLSCTRPEWEEAVFSHCIWKLPSTPRRGLANNNIFHSSALNRNWTFQKYHFLEDKQSLVGTSKEALAYFHHPLLSEIYLILSFHLMIIYTYLNPAFSGLKKTNWFTQLSNTCQLTTVLSLLLISSFPSK